MNKECNVVRDLMPLCIDGAASEESQKLVREHVSACGECAEMLLEMQTELADSDVPVEDKVLDAAAQKVNKRRIRRMVITGLIGMVMGIVLFFVAINMEEIVFRAEYVRLNGDLRLEALYAKAAEVTGQPMKCIYLSSFPSGSPKFEWDISEELVDDGSGLCIILRAVYAGWESEEHESASVLFWGYSEDGVWTAPLGETGEHVPVHRVELHSGDEILVLWELGDEVPTQQEVFAEEEQLKKDEEVQ